MGEIKVSRLMINPGRCTLYSYERGFTVDEEIDVHDPVANEDIRVRVEKVQENETDKGLLHYGRCTVL